MTDTQEMMRASYNNVASQKVVGHFIYLLSLDHNWERRTSVVQSENFRQTLLNMLEDILIECREDNWDGEEADAVSPRTIEMVEKVIVEITNLHASENLLLPDISPSPDGSILLGWRKNGNELHLGISGKGILFYSLIGPAGRGRGHEEYDGSMSERVLAILRPFTT